MPKDSPQDHIDPYIADTLMRDLVGHDRKPASFLVYLWLSVQQTRQPQPIQISYQDLAENIGISKSSAQASVAWLKRRKLISATKQAVTATPTYVVRTPWR
jgi:hypothetical protein